jgi:hypothetical protein
VLEQTRQRYRFVVLGYVVMPEHIHLLISEPEVGTPSTVMQVCTQRTARALLAKIKASDPRGRANCSATNRRAGHSGKRASIISTSGFQRLEREETGGETEIYAPQSGQTRFGIDAGGLALEQLSALLNGRTWARAREWAGGRFLFRRTRRNR